LLPESAVQATAVKQILLDHLFPPGARRLSA